MSTWLHYYNARRPDRPAAGSVSIENRYGAYYYISMGAYKRAMMKLRQRDGEVEIAFRGPERFIGEKIAVITYSFVGIEGKMIPELQIIGSVEGVY